MSERVEPLAAPTLAAPGPKQNLSLPLLLGSVCVALVGLLLLRNATIATPSFVPLILATVLGLTTRWTWPPLIVLVWLAMLQTRLQQHPLDVVPAADDFSIEDMAIAALAVVYVSVYYRHINRPAPADGSKPALDPSFDIDFDWQSWSIGIAASTVAALAFWQAVAGPDDPLREVSGGLDAWILMKAVWWIGAVATIARVALGYWASVRQPVDGAMALLESVVYADLRRELDACAKPDPNAAP